jgi:flavin-dependent dehydrogenase
LVALGFWEAFKRAGHVPGYERQCAWGGEPQADDSILQPHGPLWHVDRDRFNDDLQATIRQRADIFLPYQTLGPIRRELGKWRLSLDGGTMASAKYLVDATGRQRALARRLGGRVERHDRLLGLTTSVAREESPIKLRSMLIQATPFGWWYAAPTPKGHILALFTDVDLVPMEIRRRFRPVAANSTFTHTEFGQGWLPVGDACASHDPLCGWGVHRAMTNGLRAADAIDAFLAHNDSSQLEYYRHHCLQQYKRYLEGLAKYYSIERRWPTAPFWERRHGHASA